MKKITMIEIVTLLLILSVGFNVYAKKSADGGKGGKNRFIEIDPPTLQLDQGGGDSTFGDGVGNVPTPPPKKTQAEIDRENQLYGNYDHYDFGDSHLPPQSTRVRGATGNTDSTNETPPPITDEERWGGGPRPGHVPAPVSKDHDIAAQAVIAMIVEDTFGGQGTPPTLELETGPVDDGSITSQLDQDGIFPGANTPKTTGSQTNPAPQVNTGGGPLNKWLRTNNALFSPSHTVDGDLPDQGAADQGQGENSIINQVESVSPIA